MRTDLLQMIIGLSEADFNYMFDGMDTDIFEQALEEYKSIDNCVKNGTYLWSICIEKAFSEVFPEFVFDVTEYIEIDPNFCAAGVFATDKLVNASIPDFKERLVKFSELIGFDIQY